MKLKELKFDIKRANNRFQRTGIVKTNAQLIKYSIINVINVPVTLNTSCSQND